MTSCEIVSPLPYRIRCAEVWGGIQNVDLDLCTRGVTASLYSTACNAEQGGDISYLAVCSSDLLTRVVIADVRGHGEVVSQLSQWIYEVLRDSMDTLDGTTILRRLNRIIHAEGFHGLTTAVVAGFYIPDCGLSVCYAGHPPVLLDQRRNSLVWDEIAVLARSGPANLPLGTMAETEYDQTVVTLQRGDRIALYTDGITEGSNSDDAEFGMEGLRAALGVENRQPLGAVKQNVLAALQEHLAGRQHEDDRTLLLIEAL